MSRDTDKSRTMRGSERKMEGGREFGHVHEPSQAQEASDRHGLADDVMPDSKLRRQAMDPRQEGSHRGSGTQQSKPPGKSSQGRKRERHDMKKAA